MAEKNFNNVRIVNKHDTEANWQKATGFVPKQGELIVYDIDSNYSYERFKIGDGIQNVNKLPFVMVQSDMSVNNETDPAYIKNRTHWSEGLTTVEWDGSTDGLVTSSDNANYKVSSLKPNVSEIIGGKLVFSNGSVMEITSDMIETGGYIYSVYYGTIYVNTSNGSAYSAAIGITLPEPGIYFQKNSYNQIVSFSYGNETVYTLDEKYIPDTIARVSDIAKSIEVDETLSVAGQAADSKAVGDAIGNLNALIGDTAVSEQISSAIDEATADDFGVYVQAQEPTDAVAGDIWIDTANDPSYIPPTLPEITEVDNGKVLMVVNGKLQLVNLNLTTDANGVLGI